MDEDARKFQKIIKAERERLGISQTELAKEIGVSQPHLSYIESGRRELTRNRFEKIIECFIKRKQ